MRSLNYTQQGLASAIDRHELRRDAHFVGMSLIAVVVCMQFLSSFLVMALMAVGVLDGNATDYGLSATGMDLLNMGLYLLSLLPPVVVVALCCRRRYNPLSEHRRVRPVHFLCLLGIGMAVCVLANFIANYVATFLSQFGIGWPDATGNLQSTPTSLLINLFATAILPGFCEELVFRGYILGALRRYGDGFAIVMSSALFGLLHGNVLQIPFAFIVGLICGYLVVQTGNIWVAIVLHTLNNAMAVVLTWFEPMLTDTGNAQLNGTVLAIFSMVGIACFLGLRAVDSPLLERPSGGWTSLTRKEKWGAMFSSPAFIISVALMAFMTLLTTATYSLMEG